jgi:hypothetical protein
MTPPPPPFDPNPLTPPPKKIPSPSHRSTPPGGQSVAGETTADPCPNHTRHWSRCGMHRASYWQSLVECLLTKCWLARLICMHSTIRTVCFSQPGWNTDCREAYCSGDVVHLQQARHPALLRQAASVEPHRAWLTLRFNVTRRS